MAFIFHWSVSKYTSLHEKISYHGVIWFPGYFITIVTIVMHNNISKVVRNKLDLKNKDRTRLFSLENLRLNALLFCYSGNVRLSTGLCISPVQGERHWAIEWVIDYFRNHPYRASIWIFSRVKTDCGYLRDGKNNWRFNQRFHRNKLRCDHN